MLTLTSDASPPRPKQALTLAEFRARAAAGYPVAFFEVPEQADHSQSLRGPECHSGIATPITIRDGRPALLGFGPIPRRIQENDKLISVRCGTSIVSIFHVDTTAVIPVAFTHEHRKLSDRGGAVDLVREKALMLVMPEVPSEVDPKDTCSALLVREGDKQQIVRLKRSWLSEADRKVVVCRQKPADGREDLDLCEDLWEEWPMYKLGKLITRISGGCVAWVTSWTPEHDKVRRRRARKLSNFNMPNAQFIRS